MNSKRVLNEVRMRRVRRSRAKVFGSGEKPRLAVFRSNRFIYAQLIDDGKGGTLAAASSRGLPKENLKRKKSEEARLVGEAVAKKAAKLGVTSAVLDRRSYKYHGRVKALTEGARGAWLKI